MEFLYFLDKRYEEKIKKDGKFMAREERMIRQPSQSKPPINAPI